jgi:hypothetical protein
VSALRFLARKCALAAGLLLAVLVTGCAHPISLSPDVASLAGSGKAKIDRKIGLSISDADRQREVTGPGGGGDKVNYFPYRDLETGLYIALSESFSQVTRVSGPTDPKVKEQGLNYLATPIIVTTSSSPSMVTWPPTLFTIALTCTISDVQGNAITELRVFGEGRAEFDEFKADTSLSARRAASDVLKKLMTAIAEAAPKLR